MTAQTHKLIDQLGSWIRQCWGGQNVEQGPLLEVTLPTADYILDSLNCGILAWPYVEVYLDQMRQPDSQVYTSRIVQTHRMSGYVNRTYVVKRLRSGATVRFPSIDDWVPATRSVVEAVQQACKETVFATACLAQEGATFYVPSRDAVPAVAVQCSGRVVWRFDVGHHSERETSPGEVIYLPRELGVNATAHGGDCLVLLVEGRIFTARQLVEALQAAAQLHLEKNATVEHHHLLDLEVKADRVCEAVRNLYSAMSADDVIRYADELR